jgi:hypothetical protein
MKKPKYLFGDIVVIEGDLIGVVVKSWETFSASGEKYFNYDVYVRVSNKISNYKESEVERYRVRHKYLDEQEIEWQRG